MGSRKVGNSNWKAKTAFVAVAGGAILVAAATVAYKADYAYVAANEMDVFGMGWPAKSVGGALTGHITKLSRHGTFPCFAWDGVLQTMGSTDEPSTARPFTIRDSLMAKDAQGNLYNIAKRGVQARDNGEKVVIDYHHSRIPEESFKTNKWLQCIQTHDHAAYSVRPIGTVPPDEVSLTCNLFNLGC